MLNNRSLRKMVFYPNPRDVFSNVDIKGGICYYLIDKSYNGDCLFTLIENNNKEESLRNLNDFDILIRYPRASEIVKKVAVYHNETTKTIEEIISRDTPFGIPTNPKKSKKNPIKVSNTKSFKYEIELHYIDKGKRKIGYVSRGRIIKNASDVKFVKVFVPTGYGAGDTFPHQILGVPILASSDSVCSQSYLYIPFENLKEASSFIKYYKTKFFRALVLAVKITQSAHSKVYRFVPVQDFTDRSDIDWNKSIKEIDMQLYKKYDLNQDEIDFIEDKIKEME